MTSRRYGILGLAVVVVLAVSLGAIIGRAMGSGRASVAKPEGHAIYLISVSRITYRDADKWLVEYSLDGQAEAVELPIKAGEPDGFLGYLDRLE